MEEPLRPIGHLVGTSTLGAAYMTPSEARSDGSEERLHSWATALRHELVLCFFSFFFQASQEPWSRSTGQWARGCQVRCGRGRMGGSAPFVQPLAHSAPLSRCGRWARMRVGHTRQLARGGRAEGDAARDSPSPGRPSHRCCACLRALSHRCCAFLRALRPSVVCACGVFAALARKRRAVSVVAAGAAMALLALAAVAISDSNERTELVYRASLDTTANPAAGSGKVSRTIWTQRSACVGT